MGEATNECVLLIECQPADARLITNALTNQVHGAFAVESITKLSDGLERITKGGVRAVIVDIEMSNGRSVATIERLLTGAPTCPHFDSHRHGKRECGQTSRGTRRARLPAEKQLRQLPLAQGRAGHD